MTWTLESSIKIEGHTKKSDKTNKKSKRLQLRAKIGGIGINCFTRKKKKSLSKTTIGLKIQD